MGAFDEPGPGCSFVGWGWAKHMSGPEDRSFLSAFPPLLYLETETSQEPPQALRA